MGIGPNRVSRESGFTMANRSFTRSTPWVLAAPLALAGLLAGCGGGSSDSDGSGSISIQGVIGIAPGSRVDGDYADLWRVSGGSWPDDSRGAVDLPIPATAAGYLSATEGSYQGTDLVYPRDRVDEYRVALVEGDRYYLQCFPSDDGNVEDLDVTLSLDESPVTIGNACGSGGTAGGEASSVTLETATGSPLRYVLSIAPQGALMSFDVRWPEPALRVNEAVMSGPAAVANTLSSSGLAANSVIDSMRSIGPGLWHVTRDPGVGALSADTSDNRDPRAETIEWIRTMRNEFGLAVEPNYLVYQNAPDVGNDPFYTNSGDSGPNNWNLDQINMPSAWSQAGEPTGQGVGVALMDTGLLSTSLSTYGNWHEDLAGNVVAEGGTLDFVSSTYDVDSPDDGRDRDPATPLTPGSEASTSFHGTHVAGIVAAEDNSDGTIGVAYEATILPYRVLGVDPVTGQDGSGSVADLVDAIASAANRADVDVINLSLGGLPPLAVLQAATDDAHDNGVLVIAAGGNSGDASAVYPAAHRRVLGVGATDRNRDLASYSNYGPSIDLLAPGGSLDDGIVNAYGDVDGNNNLSSGYAYLAGSSMAAPHVTGVFALMKHVAGVTPDQFRAQLIAGNLTDTTGFTDYAIYGQGLLDANKALDPATVNDFPTVVSAWPRVLELDPSGSESEVLLEVLKATDAISDPQVASAGADVPPELILTDGDGDEVMVGDPLDGSLRIRVKPSVEPTNRPLSDNIVIPYTSDSGTRDLVIPVYLQASDEEADRNAGRHYALLLDVNNFESEKSRGVIAEYNPGTGKYRYAFSDVDPGDYILVAGTDLDNNSFICENGEACAEYLRDGSRAVISVRDGQALRFDMTTSFRRPAIAEMGLPRYGFKGYPVPDRSNADQSVSKKLE
jgi:serine protease